MKVALFGATGLLGSNLAKELKRRGMTLLLFSRKSKEGRYFWDPENEMLDPSLLENIDVVINFVGESLLGYWTKEKKRRIYRSRLQPTEFLVKILVNLKNPPKLYVGASAIGYYGEKREEVLKESDQAGLGFLADLTKAWEAKTEPLQEKMRVVLLRLGVVLASDKGTLYVTKNLFKFFMGAQFGSGKQMVSWIGIDDVVFSILHIFNEPNLSGPVNLVSPFPISYHEFLNHISKLLKRPYFFYISKKLTQRIFGDLSTVFLSDLHVYPEKLLRTNYQFKTPKIDEALKKYLLTKEDFC